MGFNIRFHKRRIRQKAKLPISRSIRISIHWENIRWCGGGTSESIPISIEVRRNSTRWHQPSIWEKGWYNACFQYSNFGSWCLKGRWISRREIRITLISSIALISTIALAINELWRRFRHFSSNITSLESVTVVILNKLILTITIKWLSSSINELLNSSITATIAVIQQWL